MLVEFIDFVDSILPAVDPDFREGAKAAILQFEKEGHILNFLTNECLITLSQGDIISDIPFTYFEEDGKQQIFKSDAMVISTSCHIDQKEKLVMVPVLPLDIYDGNTVELKRNTVYDYMYLPDCKMNNKFVNFSIWCTYNKELIMKQITEGKVKRLASLSQLGYYFLVVKLTVYLMRKEDGVTLDERKLKMLGAF